MSAVTEPLLSPHRRVLAPSSRDARASTVLDAIQSADRMVGVEEVTALPRFRSWPVERLALAFGDLLDAGRIAIDDGLVGVSHGRIAA